MHIIGAGLAGLIAGHIFRRHAPTIVEGNSTLPNNHEALLRFRSSAVGEATGIGFKKVTVRKGIIYKDQYVDSPNIFLSNMYSRKVIGEVRNRSIWSMEPSERWIAPANFTEQMANPLNIAYGMKVTTQDYLHSMGADGPVISTIPMPIMMQIVDWPDRPAFGSLSIWSMQLGIKAPICDVYQTIYYPDPEVPYYRASITGDRLIIEYCHFPDNVAVSEDAIKILEDFGIFLPVVEFVTPLKEHKFGKIAPISDEVRKDFIYTLTREFNVYSLGRFATWKQILLDDVVSDCETIKRLISSEGKRKFYHQSLEASRGGKH